MDEIDVKNHKEMDKPVRSRNSSTEEIRMKIWLIRRCELDHE